MGQQNGTAHGLFLQGFGSRPEYKAADPRRLYHSRRLYPQNEARSMSCRTMLLSLSLFGANLLPGQATSRKSALAQLSGSIRELTDRVSPSRAGPVSTALFSSKYPIPGISLAEPVTYD
jgi:hypothetical protein